MDNDAIFKELVYYLENHAFLDEVCIRGYSLSDLYVFQMSKYNLIREIGKNPVECNKERMVMNSFRMMVGQEIYTIEPGHGEIEVKTGANGVTEINIESQGRIGATTLWLKNR